MIPALVIATLFVATAFAFIHAHTAKIARRERALSNLRVLDEFKNIALHRPHYIVDHTERRRRPTKPID